MGDLIEFRKTNHSGLPPDGESDDFLTAAKIGTRAREFATMIDEGEMSHGPKSFESLMAVHDLLVCFAHILNPLDFNPDGSPFDPAPGVSYHSAQNSIHITWR